MTNFSSNTSAFEDSQNPVDSAMSQSHTPSFRSSRSALTDRSSLGNVPVSSTSLPATTFAPPPVVRFHPLPRRTLQSSLKADLTQPTSPTRAGKENAGEAPTPSFLSPNKASVQVNIEADSPPPFSRASLPAEPLDGRLSFARPTERVLHIHSIDDREALSRLSVGPSLGRVSCALVPLLLPLLLPAVPVDSQPKPRLSTGQGLYRGPHPVAGKRRAPLVESFVCVRADCDLWCGG